MEFGLGGPRKLIVSPLNLSYITKYGGMFNNILYTSQIFRLLKLSLLEQMPRRISSKWNWVSHTPRIPAEDIGLLFMDLNPQGSRAKSSTWRRSVVEKPRALQKEWRKVKALAENRVRWWIFVNALK